MTFLDREIMIFVVDESNMGIRSRLDHVRSNPIRSRQAKHFRSSPELNRANPYRRAPPRAPPKAAAPAKKMSAEDLDRELDAFMKTKQHQRITVD